MCVAIVVRLLEPDDETVQGVMPRILCQPLRFRNLPTPFLVRRNDVRKSLERLVSGSNWRVHAAAAY